VLDLRATSSGGGTSLTSIGTILAGNDGQSVAGVPVTPSANPILVAWGGLTTIADTIKEIQMISQDLLDPINAQDFTFGASSTIGYHHVYDRLPFTSAARVLKMAQNTGAANNIGYTLDWYSAGGSSTATTMATLPKYGNAQNWRGTTTYGGALTGITWKQQAFAPTTPIPAGRYAILGAWVNALTNYALLRFRHADFATFAPGFPVVDLTNPAAAQAVSIKDTLVLEQGYQFSYLADKLGVTAIPVFGVTTAGTGLNLEMAAITADTPQVTLNLAKVG
jgi:hypothetical protein